jgi:phage-related minor tail protein
MAIELATAYVSLTASAKGIGKSIAADLGDELTAPLKKAGDDAGKAAGEDAGKSFGSSLSSGLKLGAAGIAAGGALVAGLLAKGFADALDIESANAKLTAQLGLTAQQSEAYGKAAGELYASNYGSSLGEVNEALRQVTTNIGEGIGNGEDALKEVTADALNLAAVFDQDLARTTAAVGQLLKTGLADNAENAFDILTKGFQNGSNKADDLLDTFVEYRRRP